MCNVHPAYDSIFDKLYDLLVDGDTFEAKTLSTQEWSLRFTEIGSIKHNKQQRLRFLLDVLFAAGSNVATFIDPDRYEDYITLWTNAVADGFIPDCVHEDGPTLLER
jgi:hypothetical protein